MPLDPNNATPAQIAAAMANRASIIGKAQTALTNNAAFLAITTPTAAQNAAQSKALTRQVNALIRLQFNEFMDGTDT